MANSTVKQTAKQTASAKPAVALAKPAKPTAMPQQVKVSFDAWWAVAMKKVPAQHRKEIVAADFAARGLSKHETVLAYNDALKSYGVKT